MGNFSRSQRSRGLSILLFSFLQILHLNTLFLKRFAGILTHLCMCRVGPSSEICDPLRRLGLHFRADDGICNVLGSQRNAVARLIIGYMHFFTIAHWHNIKGLD
ncbi:hypothetical protein BGW80DRAFT_1384951, partial [Lactifluus volemus]